MIMEAMRAKELMDIELACIRRNITGCDRKCENCDLVQKDTDLIEAYQMAYYALDKLEHQDYDDEVNLGMSIEDAQILIRCANIAAKTLENKIEYDTETNEFAAAALQKLAAVLNEGLKS